MTCQDKDKFKIKNIITQIEQMYIPSCLYLCMYFVLLGKSFLRFGMFRLGKQFVLYCVLLGC